MNSVSCGTGTAEENEVGLWILKFESYSSTLVQWSVGSSNKSGWHHNLPKDPGTRQIYWREDQAFLRRVAFIRCSFLSGSGMRFGPRSSYVANWLSCIILWINITWVRMFGSTKQDMKNHHGNMSKNLRRIISVSWICSPLPWEKWAALFLIDIS